MSLPISQFQDRIAFMKDEVVVSFEAVNTLAQVALGALALKGLDRGTPVGVIGGHGPAVSAWLLACAQAGCTAVPLSGNPAEHEARLKMVGAALVVRCGFEDWTLEEGHRGQMPPLLADLAKRGRAGLILFSSGTSGEPKAMVQDLNSLLESYADRKPSRLPICILLSFDHIGGLNTLLGALASGAPVIVPESRSPADVAAAIEQHKAAVLPASPTFLNLLLASGEHQRRDLSSLRLITYGTEPMPPPLLERLRVAFPRAKFVQTFGTSETGIAKTESPDPGSLFMKLEGQEWKVMDGELWLRSKTSILGYLNAPNDRFTPDGWFRTGDRVELGSNNTFRVLGRAGEMINVGGEKLFPQEVEAVILEVPGVLDCRVRGEPNALTGQTVVAEIVPSPGFDPESLRSAVRSTCRAKLDRHKVPTKVSFVESVSGGRVKKVRG
jgi:acyl-coenzyme A synthetase/AMP-(fatty) acid ligase